MQRETSTADFGGGAMEYDFLSSPPSFLSQSSDSSFDLNSLYNAIMFPPDSLLHGESSSGGENQATWETSASCIPHSLLLLDQQYHRDLKDRHNAVLAHLREAAKQAQALRQENVNLKMADLDLNNRLALLLKAASDYAATFGAPTKFGMRSESVSIGDDESTSEGLAWEDFGATTSSGDCHESSTSVMDSGRVNRNDADRVQLPKSISIRSSGYLKTAQARGSKPENRSKASNPALKTIARVERNDVDRVQLPKSISVRSSGYLKTAQASGSKPENRSKASNPALKTIARVERNDVDRVQLPKSISVRSSGYLKTAQASGSKPANRSKASNPAVMIAIFLLLICKMASAQSLVYIIEGQFKPNVTGLTMDSSPTISFNDLYPNPEFSYKEIDRLFQIFRAVVFFPTVLISRWIPYILISLMANNFQQNPLMANNFQSAAITIYVPPRRVMGYRMSHFWPPGYCAVHHCNAAHRVVNRFTVHGLWAFDFFGNTLRGQNNAYTGLVAYPTLRAQMFQNWRSYTQPEDFFWRHEWSVHGSVSGFTEYRYFERTLQLSAQYDLTAILTMGGVPFPGYSILERYLVQPLDRALGQPVELICGRNNRVLFLKEVRYCVDYSTLTLIHCPPERDPFTNAVIRIAPSNSCPPNTMIQM